MRTENAYDFRKKLLTVHEPNRRDLSRQPSEKEFWLYDGAAIKVVSKSEVIDTAVRDFIDYLSVSMEISVEISDENAAVTISLADDAGVDLGEFKAYKGFVIETNEKGISILAHDERGAAQALYYLEDLMNFEGAPAVSYGVIKKKAMYSPQMVHSSYGLDKFPDEYLARIAHEGRDAVLVFTKDVNLTPDGHLDFNDLIKRAAKYGIDVYAYSYIKSRVSPEDAEAEEYYENTYGRLFRECPGLKGVTLVGESVEFPSKDPHIAKGFGNRTTVDNIPTGKVTAGWYPCEDYPVWLNFLKKIIRKYNPDADIVFWTYNWGWQPYEARIKLIESLPTDISLLATFEMYEPRKYGDVKGRCDDYTLAFEGPGAYFKGEAEAAKKRGIRLYSMTNTGGMAWDFGTVPYEPMPQQWIKRYEGMKRAKNDWGLCGIMESHHYGFYPSFISKLSKHAFLEPHESIENILKQIIGSEFGKENCDITEKALGCFSDAIRHYTPTNADQYGAFRVGPSYPLNLILQARIPTSPEAMFGNAICGPAYSHGLGDWESPLCLRIHQEIESLKTMLSYIEQGLGLLRLIENPNEKLVDLINLGQFIANCVKTGLNTKIWYTLTCRFKSSTDPKEVCEILDKMETILLEEIKNAEETIPLVEHDSRLGWEPSMLYVTDKWHLEWKIRHCNYVINSEINMFKRGLKTHLN